MAAIGLVAAGLVVLSGAVETPSARYVCPPELRASADGHPVTINPRYTAPDGTFSVAYPAVGSAYKVTLGDAGITADLLVGDKGTMRLFSQPAAGRTPQQIANQLIKQTFPDTKMAYEIPNAMVGYQPGYGLVADAWPQGSNSSYTRMRLVVMVAIKNDLALVAGAVGPVPRLRARTSVPASRRRPTCSWPSTWANTSTASAGAATPCADFLPASSPRRNRDAL